MRRMSLAVGMTLVLVMSLATVASAGNGKSYGKHIKECTGLTYGQLKLAAKAGNEAVLLAYPNLIDGLKPAWGAKKMWEYIIGSIDSCPLVVSS